MVDTIKELSSLSRKLNQSSDKINSTISAINKKLAALNLGVETWLENEAIQCDEFESIYPGQTEQLPQRKAVSYLGYCRIGDGWQLATKDGYLVKDWDKDAEVITLELTDVTYETLLKQSREIRADALRLVPRLLDAIKKNAESLLRSINEAEKAAANL